MITQKDIADKLQVSIPLVSRVLSGKIGPTEVRPELAKAIRKTAREMGYHTNRSALAFLSGQHHVLGVFLRRRAGSNLTELLIDGISQQANHFHQKLWLHVYNEATDFQKILSQINPGIIDGLIIGRWMRASLVKPLFDLQKNGMKIIQVGECHVWPHLSKTKRSEVHLQRLAVQHLVDKGCRKIAYFGNENNLHLAGLRKVLPEFGLRYSSHRCFLSSTFSRESIEQATEKAFSGKIDFDGLVLESDHFGFTVMQTLNKYGVKIPEQVKIISINNEMYTQYAPVPLTSISLQPREKGIIAVQMLIDRINGKKRKPVTVAPVLHIRQSTM